MGSLLQDVRYASKLLRSGQAGLPISILVLAVAIGAATTTYSVVSGVLLRSLPFTEPDRLVNVRVSPFERRAEWDGATMSTGSVELVRSEGGIFESTSQFRRSGRPVLTGIGEPERLNAWTVGPEFFAVLGSRPMLGRVLTEADARETDGAAVVVSHRFWMSRLGGTPDVIGRTLTLDNRIHEVVGVMPPGFEFPAEAQLWQAGPSLPPAMDVTAGAQGFLGFIGRLAPGVSIERARDRLDARFIAHAADHSDFERWGPSLAPLMELLVGPVRTPLLLLLAAVALLLLVACANVAAVLLARGIARRREFAIRLSIGATRGRLALQVFTEAVLLALVSGAGGVLLAYWAVPFVVSLIGDNLPRAAEIAVDWRVLTAALVASTLTGLTAGLLPALLATKEDVSGALKDGSIGGGTSAWRARAGEGLVVLQVGLGTLLLTGAMLLALSFVKILRTDFGFDAGGVVVARLNLSGDRYASEEQRQAFATAVAERARALPGIQAVAWSNAIPFQGGITGIPGTPGYEAPEGLPMAWITYASPAFFRVLGIEVMRGRAFADDPAADESVAIVNQAFAKAYFPRQDPLGRTIVVHEDSPLETRRQIAGVVSDARQGSMKEPPPPQIYLPTAGGSPLGFGPYLSVRTIGDASLAIADLRDIIHSVDPRLPIDRLSMLSSLFIESVARERFYTILLSSFAIIALFITLLGTYGLTAYSVSRRTREIGIRMAMGASGGHIRGITIGRTAILAGVGILLGLLGAAGTTRMLEAWVFDTSTRDPVVFGGVAMLVAAAAVLAAYPPARRAARIDPMIVLRSE